MLRMGTGIRQLMISAIRLTGVEAPMVIDGAMDSLVFRGYVDWLLTPTLQAGDIVVRQSQLAQSCRSA